MGSNPTKSRWYVPLVYVIGFTLCFSSGLLWGGLTKSPPRPPLGAVPVYPGAQGLVILDPTGKPVGLSSASPTPGAPGGSAQALTNFEFHTRDAPDDVLQFYKQSLRKAGFYQVWDGTPTPQSINVSFVRENDSGVIETVKLEITVEGAGLTKVVANLEMQPGPGGITK